MQEAIILRIVPEDFEVWRRVHDGFREARRTYGVTDGPVYRDEQNPNIALVHLNVENLDRALEYYASAAFQEAVKRAGSVQREMWIARKREL